MAITQGAHHIGLTVPSIEATRDFFMNVLEFKQVGEVPDYPAYFISDGTVMLTLWQANNPDKATPFDRKNNIGLHHLALKVKDIDTLNDIYQTLIKTEGVSIEFKPELSGNGPAQHLMAYIPGGIRLELLASGK
ncbi:VOC family protein [Leptolyngbya cf. ectocarpi LEGE 11479]|uniref:VOC family protein n=1 Tax=Leptolyngbya cf. ectocarpi LEGE 11479 TaxID=1828722 RepID=A0A928ZV44_LEPEC|nr:VOC family protein [Leptolyngbya ectocarpi]MBE9068011.1 VOC family protein [Leptolyngbya cf. ectocarpi LEGE 11479]